MVVLIIEGLLIVKPFVGNKEGAEIEKKRLREKVIEQCGTAIFVFGEQDGNSVDKTSGVWEEFQIAVSQHKNIIPIAYPGLISEEIWKTLKHNITEYPYLEKYIDLLTSEQETDVIARTIAQILDSIQ